ncbi:phosphopantetheine-binding protein [uncultured Desulfovibrio sp.]|uniref:acyl carrier protein n=1 Tax=uncultured Desulfovibrio sp. TaxID=167968 RepID=UPI0026195AE0|nr:phosphopantetheine-binding protein [uncultured Desulfovibrio sp.]
MSLTRDEALQRVIELVADIFERDAAELHAQTHLMADLPCESIDLLEISIRLGAAFHITVDDEAAFLRSLRLLMEGGAPELARAYPHLSEQRREELLRQRDQRGGLSPLTLGDLADYAVWMSRD